MAPITSTVRSFSVARPVIARLGFIGLGQMGLQMAQNLFAKSTAGASGSKSGGEGKGAMARKQFVVCDPNPDNVLALVNYVTKNIEGGEVLVVDTPFEVARRTDTIFTMLPSSPQVQAVYLGGSGILQALHSPSPSSTSNGAPEDALKSKIFIDSTTLDVHVARDVSSKMLQAGAEMIDAPVSGGVVGASAGTLSFMVGGPLPSFSRAHPFLDTMGTRIIHCGDSGNGLIAKLCNNHILGINQVAIAEGMLLGTSLGLAPDLLASIINSSTGRSWPSEINNPVPGALGKDKSPPSERNYVGGFASKLMLKDMLLAAQAAKSAGTPIPIGETCSNLYAEMIDADSSTQSKREVKETIAQGKDVGSKTDEKRLPRGDRDFSVVYDYLRELARESAARRG